MLVNVDKHEIVIDRDKYQDLKNQIKTLKIKLKTLEKEAKADAWARSLMQDDFK